MALVNNESAFGGGFPGFGGFGGGDGMGVLLGLLLARGGLGDRDRGGDCNNENGDIATAIASAAALSNLADIKAAIPQSEGDLQLALAAAVAQLSGQSTANTQFLSSGLNALQIAQLTSTAALQKSIGDVDTNVDRSTTTVVNAIRDDGNATRALITENLIAALQAEKVILSNQLAEERTERRRDGDRNSIEINMLQNQQQAQLQFQEARNDNDKLRALLFETLQLNRATNQAINIGAGTQTANPLNSQTNVKA